MKLGASQSLVQSDTGQQLHPSGARHLHHDGRFMETAFLLPWTRSRGPWWPGPRWVVAPSRKGRWEGRWPGRGGCGGGGAVLAALVLRFVLFFDFVVDVLVVQVVIWCLALCCARQGLWSRQCSPWCSAVAVLGQGGVMPVIAHVVFFVLKTVEVPQCSTLTRWSMTSSCSSSRLKTSL